jgi:hypothetical protein
MIIQGKWNVNVRLFQIKQTGREKLPPCDAVSGIFLMKISPPVFRPEQWGFRSKVIAIGGNRYRKSNNSVSF